MSRAEEIIMKTYKITIKPTSGFGTPLKGDTLFGHICWQIFYQEKLVGKSLSMLLSDYSTNPFIIVSSAYPEANGMFFFKRPDIPLEKLFDFSGMVIREIISERKKLKSKRWMVVDNKSGISSLESLEYLNDEEILKKINKAYPVEFWREANKKGTRTIYKEFAQPHNTIKRLSGTTGEEQFAPFSVDQICYMPGISLCIFVAIREDINIGAIIEMMKLIGETGFGKDASTGLGRFEIEEYKEVNLNALGSDSPNACYTLSPCVPQKGIFKQTFFSPFTRFGRHGDVHAKSGRPFKNPVIMADEGAVFIVNTLDVFKKPYIGTAISGISKVEPKAVTQGYALYIPIKVEEFNE